MFFMFAGILYSYVNDKISFVFFLTALQEFFLKIQFVLHEYLNALTERGYFSRNSRGFDLVFIYRIRNN